ncbi:phage minor head protein [Leuconostoc citreum]|uniref:phage minor head protein n=1 Tax=Leuconostoc citreum TaxID=33964 RepID=UPI0032DF763C
MAMTELELIQRINELPDNKELKSIYKKAFIRLAKDLKKWDKDFATMTDSQKSEFKRKLIVAKRMQNVLNAVEKDVHLNILNTIKTAGAMSYNGTYFFMEKKYELELGNVLISDEELLALANKPIFSKNFSKRLHNNTQIVSQRASQAIADGLVRGEGYAIIAQRLQSFTNMAYNNALRISRTESGRVASITNFQAAKNIKTMGIDIKKKWVATLDKKTRTDHRMLDGKTIELKELFTVNGYQALHPHAFGAASEDVNCRCVLINVIDDIAPEYRMDNESKQTIKDMSYEEWLKTRNSSSGT